MKTLKELRKKFNITQEKLAHDINVKQNTISNYENGSSEPDLETIKKLAKYFNVTIDYLLNTTNSDIMFRLRDLRVKKGISQKNLAESLNISRESISKYENGEQEPSYATLKRISKYFDVSIDFLLGSNDEDLIVISKQDLLRLKNAADTINDITEKLNNQTKYSNNSNNITVGNGNTITNSFNRNKDN